jgi:hypothetical protein
MDERGNLPPARQFACKPQHFQKEVRAFSFLSFEFSAMASRAPCIGWIEIGSYFGEVARRRGASDQARISV